MKSKIYFFLIIIFFHNIYFNNPTFCQEFDNNISGKIIDLKTKELLPNVNIFIPQTYWGTTSNEEGLFELQNINPGYHEIIFSIIGYEAKTIKLRVDTNSAINLDIKLLPKTYNLDEVSIVEKEPEEWKEQIEVFKQLIIGNNWFARKCELINPEVVDLFLDENDVLRASAKTPLIILNNSLGYKIECLLLDFVWDPNKNEVFYNVKPKFIDLTPIDNHQKIIWERNKNSVFRGSLQHLFLSILYDRIFEEGYQLFFTDKEKDLYSSYLVDHTTIKYNDEIIDIKENATRQKLIFDRYLSVYFYEGVKEIASNKAQYAWIKLRDKNVFIDNNGFIIGENNFVLGGYFNKSGISDMLPKFYYLEYFEN